MDLVKILKDNGYDVLSKKEIDDLITDAIAFNSSNKNMGRWTGAKWKESAAGQVDGARAILQTVK